MRTHPPESAWTKSSYSAGNGGECVEVARAAGRILVRDSKDTTYPYLTVSPDAWDRFVRGAGRGA
ncbi:DUF397 domain-containing protein [Streptomyces albiaxialis]|uniref:DUF397 domain-containing protein n=1 Tax=Streptomyces albiaxialis TaxID=329523 RepID=A0ABP5IC71_9ACTN